MCQISKITNIVIIQNEDATNLYPDENKSCRLAFQFIENHMSLDVVRRLGCVTSMVKKYTRCLIKNNTTFTYKNNIERKIIFFDLENLSSTEECD